FAATASAAEETRPPAALISYYGSALPTLLDRAHAVTVTSLDHFEAVDSFVPFAEVEQIAAAATADSEREQVRFLLHEDDGHAYDNPHPGLHHAAAAEAAWEQTQQFLAQTLATGRS